MPFTVVGVDALERPAAFTKVYAGFAPGDPLGAVVLDPSTTTTPARFPSSLRRAHRDRRRSRARRHPGLGAHLEYSNSTDGVATISAGTPAPAGEDRRSRSSILPAESVPAKVDDITTLGIRITAQTRATGCSSPIAEHDVDPDPPVAISFNKRMYIGGATDDDSVTDVPENADHGEDRRWRPDSKPTDITEQVKFNADSDAHRITLERSAASLQLGKRYTITLKKDHEPMLPEPATRGGLKLGETKVDGDHGALSSDHRNSRSPCASPAAASPRCRSSPAASSTTCRSTATSPSSPRATAACRPTTSPIRPNSTASSRRFPHSSTATGTAAAQSFTPCSFAYWAVATDHHGRIITTGMSGLSARCAPFRINDFINPSTQDDVPLASALRARYKQIGGTPISWTPGINAQMPIGSEILLGDKPEAIPRRVQPPAAGRRGEATRASS